MIDELQYYLTTRIPEERTIILLDSAMYCYDVYGTPVQDKLNDLLNSVIDLPSDEAVDILVDYIVETTVTALAEFGITVNPDMAGPQHLQTYNEILYTALNVDQHEDPHRILLLLEDVEDAEEAFSALVEELTGLAADFVLEVLVSVERDLIKRIQETTVEEVVSMEATITDDDFTLRNRAVARVRGAPCYDREGAAETVLANMGLFGVDPRTLIDACWEAINELEPQLMANACYQLACASDVDNVSVCACARQIAEEILTDDQAVLKQQTVRLLATYPTPVTED